MMNERLCPVDGARLTEIDMHGVVVDQCPLCRGIWCDRGELEVIVNRASRALAKLRRGQTNRKPFQITNPAMREPGVMRSCPTDGAGLVHRERHGIAVDLCPLCLGIWLDKDELQAIINLTTECLLNMGPDVDFDTVELPLAQEPDRVVSHSASKMSQAISRKELLRYDQEPGLNINPEDILDVMESLTSIFTDN